MPGRSLQGITRLIVETGLKPNIEIGQVLITTLKISVRLFAHNRRILAYPTRMQAFIAEDGPKGLARHEGMIAPRALALFMMI